MPGSRLQLLQLAAETETDAGWVLGVGALRGKDQGQLLPGGDGASPFDQDAAQDGRRPDAGLEHVDVRGGVVQHQGVSVRHHPRG